MEPVSLLASWEGRAPAEPGLEGVHERGRALLERTGLPDRRNEDWKYTNAARLAEGPWRARAPGTVDEMPDRALVGPSNVLLVDGRVDEGLTLDAPGVGFHALDADSVGSVLGASGGFDAVNEAFLGGGLRVTVADGVRAPIPLHIVHVATGGDRIAAARLVVELGRGSRLQLVEHWLGLGPALTAAITEVRLGEGAELHHTRFQDDDPEAGHHVGTVAAELAADAKLHSLVVTLGAAMSRLDLRVRLAERGAEAHLDGLYLLRGRQHADHHLHVDHAAPHTTSRQHYKGILDGSARGVFTGRVVVRKDAQKIDSAQSNHNLLLSEDAVVNSRPQLEILADDVKCAHGVAIGRLDPEAAFYLRSRGLDEAATRSLLTSAYAHEVLARLPEGPLRTRLEARVAGWLAGP